MPGTLKLTHDQMVMDSVGKRIFYNMCTDAKMNADTMMSNLFPSDVKPIEFLHLKLPPFPLYKLDYKPVTLILEMPKMDGDTKIKIKKKHLQALNYLINIQDVHITDDHGVEMKHVVKADGMNKDIKKAEAALAKAIR